MLRQSTFAVLSLFLFVSCDRRLETPTFQVDESFIQVSSSRNDVFWLDDNTLVFAGADNGAEPAFGTPVQPKQVNFPENKARIYLWHLGKPPRVYKPKLWPAEATPTYRNFLCAGQGKIYYSTAPLKITPNRSTWTAPVMSGALGKESPSVLRYMLLDEEWSPRTAATQRIAGWRCEQFHDPLMKGHVWVISYSGQSTLDFGLLDPDAWPANSIPLRRGKLKLLRTADRHAITVSRVDPQHVRASCTLTPAWEESFVVWGCPRSTADFQRSEDLSIWKIRTEGNVEHVNVHTEGYEVFNLIPFRYGYFVRVVGAKGIYNDAAAVKGLYLVENDGRLRQVLQGNEEIRAVSPNGCLAAFAKPTVNIAAAYREHLVIFDLCRAARR